MTNLAVALKDEIRRLARKEIRAHVSTTKRATVQHRREIAKLKRMLQQQEKQLRSLKSMAHNNGTAAPEPAEDAIEGARFSARSVRAQRQRLRLSAQDYGKVVGVSGQTIYHWEQGKSRPRKSQMASLVAVRGLGQREAQMRLETLRVQKKGRRRVSKPR